MTTTHFLPIAPDALDAMRAAGHDDYGNPLRRRSGSYPLRCCLRPSRPDEDIMLICYSPWTERSPWLEAGPVFVHWDRCAGYPDSTSYPQELARGQRMLNPFDRNGQRAYAHITFIGEVDDHERAARAVLNEPEVDHLHVRSATAGCFLFEVRAVP